MEIILLLIPFDTNYMLLKIVLVSYMSRLVSCYCMSRIMFRMYMYMSSYMLYYIILDVVFVLSGFIHVYFVSFPGLPRNLENLEKG